MLAAVVAGVAFRLVFFARNRPLWYDEASVAANVVHRTWGALFRPLSGTQTAPPLFLVLLKGIMKIAGSGECTLRLVALVSGIALMPFAYAAARRLSGLACAAVAISLLAVSPTLTTYSAEVKPYSTDALVTVLLILAALRARDRSFEHLLPLAFAGIFGLLFSIPAIFTLGGISAFVFFQRPARRAAALVLGATWGATFLVLLRTAHRAIDSGGGSAGRLLHAYWRPYFLDVPLAELPRRGEALFYELVPLVFFGNPPRHGEIVMAMLLAVGVVVCVRRNRMVDSLLLVIPVALLLVAARLAFYPIASRVSLFAAFPLSIFLATAIVGWNGTTSSRLAARAQLAAATLIVAFGVRGAVGELRTADIRQEESRAFIANILNDSGDASPVWLSAGTGPAWEFYSATTLLGPPRDQRPPIVRGGNTDSLAALPDAERDSGFRHWGSEEIARVIPATAGCVRLLLVHSSDAELESLREAITASGGIISGVQSAPKALRFRACFGRATTAGGSGSEGDSEPVRPSLDQ